MMVTNRGNNSNIRFVISGEQFYRKQPMDSRSDCRRTLEENGLNLISTDL
jgi:hypothetical protein